MFGGFTHVSGELPGTEDLDISLAAVLLSESCNIPLTEVARPGVKALSLGRLVGADQGYFRAECIGYVSGLLVDRQAEVEITGTWDGGLVASADGMHFVVPVPSLHAGPNPKYFVPRHGVTWLNVVSDRVMGLGGLVVPGTLRDSMVILDAIFNLDVATAPELVIADNASYSDIVFGLFAICGYQFAPRIADISDARLWRVKAKPAQPGERAASYGARDAVSRNSISVGTVRAHWEDMPRVAGSLITGQVRAYDLIRMMQHDGRTTGLGKAFAHYGRIFKTLHLLPLIDAAVKALEPKGTVASDEVKARISLLESVHITFHGRYSFRRPHLDRPAKPGTQRAHVVLRRRRLGPCSRERRHLADKGARVVVPGRLDQRSGESAEGDKRSEVEIKADDLAPSLRWATAQVTRNERRSGDQAPEGFEADGPAGAAA
jgi:TnpA family transposase